jgi:hypothetical protein
LALTQETWVRVPVSEICDHAFPAVRLSQTTRRNYSSLTHAAARVHGATVARLTPDQTVGRSNRSGLSIFGSVFDFGVPSPNASEVFRPAIPLVCLPMWARGVVVSRLLCMQKASGSNPDESSVSPCYASHNSGFMASTLAKARLAQSVERQPFKLVVVGSSPTVGVISCSGCRTICVDGGAASFEVPLASTRFCRGFLFYSGSPSAAPRALLAQWLERAAVNRKVTGSIPVGSAFRSIEFL